MNLEIQKPEIVQRVYAYIKAGHFHDADEVIEKALDALEERGADMSTGQAGKSDDKRSGADLIAALQSSPFRELDIEPPRFRVSVPVRDITF